MQGASGLEKWTVVGVADKETVHIPALSIATIMVRGRKSLQHECSSNLLLEPSNSPLPGDLVVVPSLVSATGPMFPFQVVNLSSEDVWLQARTRLRILCPV